jgi:hypothetical protein
MSQSLRQTQSVAQNKETIQSVAWEIETQGTAQGLEYDPWQRIHSGHTRMERPLWHKCRCYGVSSTCSVTRQTGWWEECKQWTHLNIILHSTKCRALEPVGHCCQLQPNLRDFSGKCLWQQLPCWATQLLDNLFNNTK